MAYYSPRMLLKLHVPIFGSTVDKRIQERQLSPITIDCKVRKATLTRDNHLTAGELMVEVDWAESGIDPRYLKNAQCDFYCANGDEELTDPKNLRFKGVMVKAKRLGSFHGGLNVVLTFHDYTAYFIEAKPFPTDGTPLFTDTLSQAWERVCDHTGFWDTTTQTVLSSVERLKKNLVIRGDIAQDELSKVANSHFTRMGARVPIKWGCNAWEAWQFIMGMLGYMSYIDLDKCVVERIKDHYREGPHPVAFWGYDIYDLSEESNSHSSAKGLRGVSMDSLTGTMIESYYPRAGDPRIRIKRATANSKKYDPNEVRTEQYFTINLPECGTQDQLDRVTEAAYYEWARQELEGSFKTGEMFLENPNGDRLVDVLDLRAGDSVEVKFDNFDKALLKNKYPLDNGRQYLIDLGYDPNVADLIAKNLEDIDVLQAIYHVEKVITTIDERGFEAEIKYHNLVNLKGYTEDAAKPSTIKPDDGVVI